MLWKGLPMFPGLGGNFGTEFLPLHAANWGGGDPSNVLTVTLMDVWVLPPVLVEQLAGRLVCWTPVDHDPAPPGVLNFLREGGAVPLAMSRFGQEALSEFAALYCPHAVDTTTYLPQPQEMAREETGVDKDAFLVGWVAANKGRPSRKGFQYGLEAFKKLRERHENALLYLHTSLRHQWMEGENLPALIDSLEIPSESVLWADQYRLHFDPHPPRQMASIYSTFDVLLNPATGGGFEICQLEAAACGVPSITVDSTGTTESAGPTPWKVSHGDPDSRGYWTGQNSWNTFASVGALDSALEECYRMRPEQRKKLSLALRKHAEAYDADRVYAEYMLPALRKAEKRIRKRSVAFDVTEGLRVEMPERPPAKDGPTISVVTPWYNHPELAEDYFRAVGGERVEEIIIIDNASEPMLEAPDDGRVRILHQGENLGFSRANNVGLEAAKGEAVLFLNNDIALGIPGWLEAIRSELRPGQLVGANQRVDEHTRVDGELMPYLEGWCLAGYKEDFERIGAWDEDYEEPAYYSDNDLSLRAARAGMSFAAVSPPLIHLENVTAGPSRGKVAEVTRRNFRRFAEKVREAEGAVA